MPLNYQNINKEDQDSYYYSGFSEIELLKNELHYNYLNILSNININNLKINFIWKQVYNNSLDLIPKAYEYDDIFLDYLFSQNIPEILINKTGYSDLILGDLSIRKVFPGSVYMGWHRDTYCYGSNNFVGRTPPLQKIIFYPSLGNDSTLQLELLSGSHLRVNNSKLIDRFSPIIHKSKVNKIYSNDDKFILFNSSIFHNVPESKDKLGALRVFYNFCHISQLSLFKGRESLHSNYINRLNNFNKLKGFL